MPINYRENYDKMITLALMEIKGIAAMDGKKEEHIAKANMYANVANALSNVLKIDELKSTVTKEKQEVTQNESHVIEEKESVKEPTKEDLKPAPRVVGSEDSPESSVIIEKTPSEKDTEKMTKEIGRIKEIIDTLKDTAQHRNGYSVPMSIIMHWCSQVVGTEITDMNQLNSHLDKLSALTDYFEKLDFIFNRIGATLKDAEQALAIGTQGNWTKIPDMSPDNIDPVIEVFKKYIAQQQEQQQ